LILIHSTPKDYGYLTGSGVSTHTTPKVVITTGYSAKAVDGFNSHNPEGYDGKTAYTYQFLVRKPRLFMSAWVSHPVIQKTSW